MLATTDPTYAGPDVETINPIATPVQDALFEAEGSFASIRSQIEALQESLSDAGYCCADDHFDVALDALGDAAGSVPDYTTVGS